MSLFANLYNRFRRLLVGQFAGLPLAGPDNDYVSGRDLVLGQLGDYLGAINFLRSGGEGKAPTAFRVKNFYAEQPDNETDLVFPSFAVVSSRGEYLSSNLAPFVVEDTRDLYGPYTVVRMTGQERREVIILEAWASSRAERRAMIDGLAVVLNPREDAGGLRLRVPSYYDVTASFAIVSDNLREDAAVLNRRTGLIEVEVLYPIAHLVKYANVRPAIDVDVRSPDQPFTDGTTDLDTTIVQ